MRREKIAIYEWRTREFVKRLKGEVLGASVPLSAEVRVTGEQVPFVDRTAGEFRPIAKGEKWGELWDYGWLHITGVVPHEWQGQAVLANLEVSPEACVFDDEGCPVTGLTRWSVFSPTYTKSMYHLCDSCKGGEIVDLWVEGASSHWGGVTPGEIAVLDLCVFRKSVWEFLLDFEVLHSLMDYLPKAHPRRARILKTLSLAIDRYRDDPVQAEACREILRDALASPANASDLTAISVGHAHIDTGWMWPVRTTVGKVIRTFASQVSLIEKYPGYVFGASQPQHYVFVKERYPELYEKIRKHVKDGTWELQGGMWVESDCNLTDGESMVRQFLYGKNFFMDEFGEDVRNLWLPDVFGYSAAMPQILRKAGVDFFLTQKLSWSQFNEFPHNTFLWRGIDGSEVLTHFPPENTYNSQLWSGELGKAQDRFKENAFLDEFLCVFGVGDGGGGPSEETIERGLRLRNLEGAPKVRFGRADVFFDNVQKRRGELERWVGELYLELHRGTLTTQALAKKRNRQIEQKLRHVEFLCSCLPFSEWPKDDLDFVWKKLLINQFHDILPGSSVVEVYEDTHAEYEDCLERCERMIEQAGDGLLTRDADSATLFNSLSYMYSAPVLLPEDWRGSDVEDAEGQRIPVQDEKDGLAVLADVPAQGFATLKRIVRSDPSPHSSPIPQGEKEPDEGTAYVLENDLIRYTLDGDGKILSAFDKDASREVVPEGEAGNVLSLYEDRPNNWEAWDIDCYYEDQLLEQARGTSVEAVSSGAVRQCLRFSLRIGNSTIEQRVVLPSNSKRLDFVTEVEWSEQRRMLRVAFPTTVRAEQATFDIQYGAVKRNTHGSNNWDMARFEVAAHRYVDLSDQDYGVAMLNNCKYGHKVRDHVLDLNLLRAPHFPDEGRKLGFTDQGHHSFTYSLLPHEGRLEESRVIAEAAMLNREPVLFAGLGAEGVCMPCTLEAKGLSLEVVKKAEKEDCLVIRIVETQGRTSTGRLHFAGGKGTLVETNLMEWEDGAVQDINGELEITFKPFEIRTYKVKM